MYYFLALFLLVCTVIAVLWWFSALDLVGGWADEVLPFLEEFSLDLKDLIASDNKRESERISSMRRLLNGYKTKL
jgi:hypothetical protein